MAALEEVLGKHKATSRRYVGIRWVVNHEPSWPQVYRGDYFKDPQFREGFLRLMKGGGMLAFNRCGWDDADVACLCDSLAFAQAPDLT